MKLFIRAVAFFFIPIVLFTVGMETYLRTMDTDYQQKLNGLIQNYDKVEILVLGNSHAYNGIDPNQFNVPTYNMAASNQSLYFDKRITLKHINHLKNLKYVLINVDFHSLYFSSQGIRDTWLYYDYDIKYKEKNELLSDFSHFWFGYTPKISLSIIKDNIIESYTDSKTRSDYVIKGWMPRYGRNKNSFSNSKLKDKGKWFNGQVERSSEREENIMDLNDFVKQLKNRNITPILYTSPMYKDLYKYLNKDYVIKNSLDIKSITKKNNIEYWDFSDNNYDKNLFYNMDHLNRKGAVIFSRELNKLFNNIYVDD